MYREELSHFDWTLMYDPADPPADRREARRQQILQLTTPRQLVEIQGDRREAIRQQILGLTTPRQLVEIQEQVRRREAQGGLVPTPNGFKQKAQSF
jgi:hypothetical protein